METLSAVCKTFLPETSRCKIAPIHQQAAEKLVLYFESQHERRIPMISTAPPFAQKFSKGERRVYSRLPVSIIDFLRE
jgi:hypothetical protein